MPSETSSHFSRDFVPLSVRHGGPRVRLGWWLKGRREAIALRLAPWLASDLRHAREQEWIAAENCEYACDEWLRDIERRKQASRYLYGQEPW